MIKKILHRLSHALGENDKITEESWIQNGRGERLGCVYRRTRCVECGEVVYLYGENNAKYFT